jgi:hypothetical protein
MSVQFWINSCLPIRLCKRLWRKILVHFREIKNKTFLNAARMQKHKRISCQFSAKQFYFRRKLWNIKAVLFCFSLQRACPKLRSSILQNNFLTKST